MACIVYQTNKSNGHMYAYSAVAYRDPVTKRPKSKRTYLGRVDPETKELIKPARSHSDKNEETVPKGTAVHPEAQNLDQTLNRILSELAALKLELTDMKNQMRRKDEMLTTLGQQLTRYAAND